MGEANRRKAARGEPRDFIMPKHSYPYCGTVHDGMLSVEPGVSPYKIKNDTTFGICIKCHYIFVYEKGKSRELTNEEMYKVAGDKILLKAMEALGHVKKQFS